MVVKIETVEGNRRMPEIRQNRGVSAVIVLSARWGMAWATFAARRRPASRSPACDVFSGGLRGAVWVADGGKGRRHTRAGWPRKNIVPTIVVPAFVVNAAQNPRPFCFGANGGR